MSQTWILAHKHGVSDITWPSGAWHLWLGQPVWSWTPVPLTETHQQLQMQLMM